MNSVFFKNNSPQQSIFLKSRKDCKLAIGNYRFEYNAIGGGGKGICTLKNKESVYRIYFNPNCFRVPPLNWKTTTILGVPILPGIRIEIILKQFEGFINSKTGDMSLDFSADFELSIFKLFKAPKLVVETALSTYKVNSNRHKINGMSIQKDGRVKLVGLANILPTGNLILDKFLSLPNEALAVLNCEVSECSS